MWWNEQTLYLHESPFKEVSFFVFGLLLTYLQLFMKYMLLDFNYISWIKRVHQYSNIICMFAHCRSRNDMVVPLWDPSGRVAFIMGAKVQRIVSQTRKTENH